MPTTSPSRGLRASIGPASGRPPATSSSPHSLPRSRSPAATRSTVVDAVVSVGAPTSSGVGSGLSRRKGPEPRRFDMTRTLDNHRLGTDTAVGVVFFLCLFAGQAGLIAISPLLSDVARDLDVSTAAAGQLRTIGGIGAAVTALLLGRVGRRFGLRTQLLAGSGFVALASVASAAAPTFAVLAVAQLPLGIGIATLTTAGTVAAAAWVPVERRRRVLSWALVGNPAAWIVGMPLIGLVGEQSWRLAWLALPLAAAVVAGAVLLLREADPPARTAPASVLDAVADPCLKRWL